MPPLTGRSAFENGPSAICGFAAIVGTVCLGEHSDQYLFGINQMGMQYRDCPFGVPSLQMRDDVFVVLLPFENPFLIYKQIEP